METSSCVLGIIKLRLGQSYIFSLQRFIAELGLKVRCALIFAVVIFMQVWITNEKAEVKNNLIKL